jgi:DNA-binding XRE family transcriptional regulator
MSKKSKWKRIVRPATQPERARHAEIRAEAMQAFPPLDPPSFQPAANGIGAQIRAAREAQGLTRFGLAEKAGVANSTIIRDIEFGRDVNVSVILAVASVLGLELSLVESAKEAT